MEKTYKRSRKLEFSASCPSGMPYGPWPMCLSTMKGRSFPCDLSHFRKQLEFAKISRNFSWLRKMWNRWSKWPNFWISGSSHDEHLYFHKESSPSHHELSHLLRVNGLKPLTRFKSVNNSQTFLEYSAFSQTFPGIHRSQCEGELFLSNRNLECTVLVPSCFPAKNTSYMGDLWSLCQQAALIFANTIHQLISSYRCDIV